MYIKICGITKLDQAIAIATMGIDALGFICVPSSPRYITALEIGQITAQIMAQIASKSTDRQCDFVGVFLNADQQEIAHTVAEGRLTAVQLHGDESVQFCHDLRSLLQLIHPHIKIIKAIRVKNQEQLTAAAKFGDAVDAILLDAYDPNLAGGTGKTIDWQMLRDFRPDCPWWLAGGLSPANVTEAIALVHPDGIDLSSGVERSAGDKDLAQVQQLVDTVRSFKMSGGDSLCQPSAMSN